MRSLTMVVLGAFQVAVVVDRELNKVSFPIRPQLCRKKTYLLQEPGSQQMLKEIDGQDACCCTKRPIPDLY